MSEPEAFFPVNEEFREDFLILGTAERREGSGANAVFHVVSDGILGEESNRSSEVPRDRIISIWAVVVFPGAVEGNFSVRGWVPVICLMTVVFPNPLGPTKRA